jgi:hypothetical protein
MKVCIYNEFEYYNVFDYYLNVYVWILLCEVESCMNLNLKFSNVAVICIVQITVEASLVSASLS